MDRRARARSAPRAAPLASFGCRKTYPERWKLTHLQRRRGRHRRDALIHCVLHLLEGPHLDLAHALARDAEFLGQLLERDRLLREPARRAEAAFARARRG